MQKEKAKDQGNLEIAVSENSVCRFPPEPSGYLHIGHAKAAFLNSHFAKHLRVRFDDTNPEKESLEFEESILEDLNLIGIKDFHLTNSSDYFNPLIFFATEFINNGFAYVDNTVREVMREERDEGIKSKNRDNSVEMNLDIFQQMLNNKCHDYCLRAKMDYLNVNKALRDPVIMRFNFVKHYKLGEKYFIYPTYDFACPIVDSIEGITDVFRTNEYRDRNSQYDWFITKAFEIQATNHLYFASNLKEKLLNEEINCKERKRIFSDYLFFLKIGLKPEFDFLDKIINFTETALNIEIIEEMLNNFDIKSDWLKELIYYNYFVAKTKPKIIDFSRLNFENTILSKRKLKELISENNLKWNDPRMPTIKGIKRKGLDMSALKEYILMQGVAQKTATISWDKLYSINKRVIDCNSGRYSMVLEKWKKEFKIQNFVEKIKEVFKFNRNESLGKKKVFFGETIILDSRDVGLLKENEEFTLINFSAAKLDGEEIVLLDKDPRKLKNKFQWLSKKNSMVVKLVEYKDLLIDDKFNTESKEEEWAIVENAVNYCEIGDFVQFERDGHYYVDGHGLFHLVPFTKPQRKY